jgi:FlaA1/EpsC-like NDP-sugar epimerase
MSRLLSFFWKYNLPRWSILIIDLIICAFSLTLAFFLRFNFKDIPPEDLKNLPYDYAILLSIRAISFIISKTYKGVVRYTGSRDSMRILAVVILGSVLMFVVNAITYFTIGYFIIPSAIIIIDALVTLFIMISSRLAVKAIYFESRNPERSKINVLIYGAGEGGIITKRTLDRDAAIKYKVVGFIDDDENKKGRSLEGAFVYSFSEIDKLAKENGVESVIISVQNLSPAKKNEIADWCLNNNVRLLNVPPATKWINGELSFNQLRGVNIEDLLEREPIKLDNDIINAQLNKNYC